MLHYSYAKVIRNHEEGRITSDQGTIAVRLAENAGRDEVLAEDRPLR
jgi:hypothetical protein